MKYAIDDVPYNAPVVERGVGFFETALLTGRRATLWEQHLTRLTESLTRLSLPCPDREEIGRATATAVAAIPLSSVEESGLRLSWIALGSDLDEKSSWRLDVSVRPIPEVTLRRREGARAVSLPGELTRDTPGVKSTSYLAAILGGRYAQRHQGNEGLFVAADGSYTEGASTALLAWSEGALSASPHAMLPSVTAAAFAAETTRRPLTASLLREGAILLGSLTKATPLRALDGEPCALPSLMLERIADFNRRLEEEAVLLSGLE